MAKHLVTQAEFVRAFTTFAKELQDQNASLSPENTIRLFDIWLGNTKDERFLDMQQNQTNNDDEPWKRTWPDED
jgi:hypothetical protein